MTKLIEDMLALQSLLKLGETATPEQKARIEELRARIPEPILAHFLRQLATGRKGLALVRNGVCGECHIRLSGAMTFMLGRSNDLLVCENCGAFVALAPGEPVTGLVRAATTAPDPADKPKARRVRKAASVVAA